jgi:hypothetical protein
VAHSTRRSLAPCPRHVREAWCRPGGLLNLCGPGQVAVFEIGAAIADLELTLFVTIKPLTPIMRSISLWSEAPPILVTSIHTLSRRSISWRRLGHNTH